MHEYVFFNDKIFSAAEVSIGAVSSAALYGKGIFTTTVIYDAKLFLWDKHWLRLGDNAKKTGIDLSEYNEETVTRALSEIIEINNLTNARARITFFNEAPSGIWSFKGHKRKTGLLILTAERREVSANYRLTVSPFRINSASPLANVKSCNYLEKLIAIEGARKRGFDEAVQLNERGEIASACMANIFWTMGDKLFTPSLSTGCLAGTTREFLMSKSSCIETEDAPDVLQKADAVFLTSSGLGVVQISEFGNRKFERKYDKITRAIS